MERQTTKRNIIGISFLFLCVCILVTSVNVHAMSIGIAGKENAEQILLDTQYVATLPRSSESYYSFELNKKNKLELTALYDAGYFEILDANYNLVYAGTEDEKMYAPQDWRLTKKLTLKKGKYYLHLYTKSSYAGDRMQFILKDMNAPTAPKVKKVKSKGVVSGKAAKGTTVYVKYQKKTYKKQVSDSGLFSIKTSKMKKGSSVSVWNKSINGIKSTVKTYKVK